jgi:uncharacterized membrane protein YphA (DoxX/SURF4 family)
MCGDASRVTRARLPAADASSWTGEPMKIVTIIVRVLMGLLFVFASITYFFKLVTPPPATGAMKTFHDGLEASAYLLPTVKLVELLCGLAFVSGRFVPLATVLIAPVLVNIFLVHAFLDPSGLPLAVLLIAANCFLAYRHWNSYEGLLVP